jgi:cytochrome b6-f complex iron-sulfur subunit
MKREDFLKSALGLCGLAVIPAAVLESCTKSNTSAPSNVNLSLDLTASGNNALNNVGGYIITNGLIIIRYSATQFVALSASCTHEGCTVAYDNSQSKVLCHCHGGSFNATTGAVLGGPPPSALAKYTTSLSGNILTVKS